MARVSLDDLSSSESAKGGSSRSSKPAGGKSPKLTEGLDPKQKIKAGVAIGVIVLAGAFIVWNTGLLNSGQQQAATGAPDATAEEVQAYNEALEKQERARTTGGNNTREAPMPLGAN